MTEGGRARPDGARLMAILSLAFALLTPFTVAPLFGPAAIVLGVIAGRRGEKLGWWGMGLGIFGLLWPMLALTACMVLTPPVP